jgi:hypothetical protein
MTTVWIYVDTNKEVGDVDHLKISSSLPLRHAVESLRFFLRDSDVILTRCSCAVRSSSAVAPVIPRRAAKAEPLSSR